MILHHLSYMKWRVKAQYLEMNDNGFIVTYLKYRMSVKES